MSHAHTIWTKISGFEYLVSISGDILRLERSVVQSMIQGETIVTYPQRHVKKNIGKAGYIRNTLSKEGNTTRFSTHRLVLSSFSGNSDLQVNHINGIHNDNRIENLEWCTAKENEKHSWDKLGKSHSKKSRLARSISMRLDKKTNKLSYVPKTMDRITALNVLRECDTNSFLYLAKKYKTSIATVSYIYRGYGK